MPSPRAKRAARAARPSATASPGGSGAGAASRIILAVALALLLAALGFAAWQYLLGGSASTQVVESDDTLRGPAAREPELVGAAACASCHPQEYARWRASQHAVAMQVASAETVRGDFAEQRLTFQGATFELSRHDGSFWVRTDGPDGEPATFAVKYTFGIYPLQQYLVALPGGRLQALPIAWDTRPREQGGQRWLHLYPEERIDFRDELHWTGRQQNWNYMCADCHSTNVRKNYDLQANRYATTWSEINVACEACHGPGSQHLAWAAAGGAGDDPHKGLTVALTERRDVAWAIDPATGNAVRSAPNTTHTEIEVCAQCHSRRTQIADGYQAGKRFLDFYLPALLTPPLYYADGQQRGEVYKYASFLQSKMYHRGVTCSDCHDPHDGQLRAPGNAVCARCHAPAKYDAKQHHFHEAGSPGAQCVACHMPPTDYMVIDARHDHSLRVPRPDLSVSLDVPNACNRCHTDRQPSWAAEKVRQWYGKDAAGFQAFAPALHAAASGAPRAGIELATLAAEVTQPAVARATALADLSRYLAPSSFASVRQALGDPDPLVRRAALSALDAVPEGQRLVLAAPLLDDALRVVRMEAARVLASAPDAALAPAVRTAFERAMAEYVESQRYNADRPENRTNLGTFFARRRRFAQAETELRAAIALDPRFVQAYVNLADLFRVQGREGDAEQVLRRGLVAVPDDASLHHALGLALVRVKRLPQALEELARAATLAPSDARFTYTYAVALSSTGKPEAALRLLREALKAHPGDRDILFALATFSRDQGAKAQALDYARQLTQLYPDDPTAAGLVRELGQSAP